ncbi:MAG TPA: glycosyltransferase family 4 protein [Nitrospira sp.]|nr:glycosyltransferase family 4 protein [Nitrospira sp.]
MSDRPRLLYLITEDWYFWSHRLDLARQAARAGFDVSIATRVTEHGERIRKEGLKLLPIRLDRRSRNPFAELAAVLELVRIYRRERPMIVHHVALKPIVYGSLAAWWSGVPIVVNAFAGLGYVFTDQKRQRGALAIALQYVYRILLRLNKSLVVFQNRDDRDLLIEEKVVALEQTRIISGSGVDTKAFDVGLSRCGSPVVMFAGRMLWDKGIADFIEAVRRLKREKVSARFVLVGRCDEYNPAAIERAQLQSWVNEGLVEWWQHREDMPSVFAEATIVVLASYREGLPKTLLEAAACGKPLVATDVPGCREIVSHGINGLLVPPRNPTALATAIDSLLSDATLRAKMGQAGREAVLRSFSVEKVTDQLIALYRELIATYERSRATGLA